MSCNHPKYSSPYSSRYDTPQPLCPTHFEQEMRRTRIYAWLTRILIAVAAVVFYGCCTALGEALTKAIR